MAPWPKLFVPTVWFMLNPCFSSRSLEFCSVLGRGDLCDNLRDSQNPWALGPSRASLGRHHFTPLCHPIVVIVSGGIKHLLCDSREEGLLEACTGFPLDFAPRAFPFAALALYSFTVINLSLEYNYMLSSVSLAGESSRLGWSCRPQHRLFHSFSTILYRKVGRCPHCPPAWLSKVLSVPSWTGPLLFPTCLNPARAPSLAHVLCPPRSILRGHLDD